MLYKTSGIVLTTTKYSETSVVAKIYTQSFGMQSYMINGVRRPKAKITYGMLQALTLLEMEVYNNPQKSLQRIAEAKAQPLLLNIYQNPELGLLAQSIAEVCSRAISESETDEGLFFFLQNQVLKLENESLNPDFLISFLIEFSQYLGFAPKENYNRTNKFFNLNEGFFETEKNTKNRFSDLDSSRLMGLIVNKEKYESNKVPAQTRQKAIRDLIYFYELHLPSFKNLKTIDILEKILF